MKSSAKLKSKWSLTGSSRASLHAKAMTIDDKTLFVGSMNWDPRSAALNTEMAVVIEQPEYVQAFLAKLPSQLKDNAYRLTLRDGDIVWTNTKLARNMIQNPKQAFFAD